MPHPGPLDALRARLQVEMSPQHISHALPWGNPRVMTEVLHRVQRDFGGEGGRPPTDDLLKSSLEKFVKTQQVASFTELKYVCYGVTVPVGKDLWRLVDQPVLFNELLGLVSAHEAQPKQFRRCYQGLLMGYFGFDRYATAGAGSAGNWQSLRVYLNEHLLPMRKAAKTRGTEPGWLQTLYEHKNLLTDDPCSRYAKGLQRSDPSELKAVCAALGIASSSWVWEEALMAYVRAVCADKEPEFKRRLPTLLKMVNGEFEIRLPGSLSTQAVALAVTRYSSCSDITENNALRDTCLHWIGNPWINRTAWDAHVNHEPARQMVNGWLKRRLIKDFFELLAQDGSADLRRLNYWLKWEPQISDMWFVLGANARDNHGTAFMELRKHMAGRDRVLTDNNHQNNAFVMRIGQLLVIEFGVTGNACYAFPASDFRTSLERKFFTISDLKQKSAAKRLSHQSYWEGSFDYELRRLLQSVPMSKGTLITPIPVPAAQPTKAPLATTMPVAQNLPPSNQLPKSINPAGLQKTVPATAAKPTGADLLPRHMTQDNFNTIKILCIQHGVDWENNLSKSGAFWVLIPDRTKRPGFASLLDRYGFKYTEGKGFWLKD